MAEVVQIGLENEKMQREMENSEWISIKRIALTKKPVKVRCMFYG